MKKLCAIFALVTLAGCGGETTRQEPAPPAAAESAQQSWFVEITEEVKLDFKHSGGSRGDYHLPEITGPGGALFDVDGDGDLDLYLVDGGSVDGGAVNRMFRRESDGTFTDVTETSGLGDDGYGMGCALGDVDNDGDLDLFVTNFGPDALYLNLGGGRFGSALPSAGFDDDVWSTSACFLDYDRDGLLDLYVVSYVDYDPSKSCTDKAGNPDYCGPSAFRGERDRLYRGVGNGAFRDVSAEAMPGRPANKGLGVVCADLDGDGWTDIYVANDGEQNQLWLNRGRDADGLVTLEDRALLLGAAVNLFSRPEAGMGIAVGDVDGDLDLDLFVTHLERETNTLYSNLGDAGFVDRTAATGLGPPSLLHTGFGTALFDADLDGDLDLGVVNGRVSRGASPTERAERQRAWRAEEGVPPLLREFVEPNLFFTNDGQGGFRDASAQAGRFASAIEVSRGLLTGDLDADGDLDLVVTSVGGPARVFRNDAPRQGHWLRLRAVDPELNRDALGAIVQVRAGGRTYLRPVISAQGFLTAVEPEVHFGLGGAERVDDILVVWPDGTREAFPATQADRVVVLLKGEGEAP